MKLTMKLTGIVLLWIGLSGLVMGATVATPEISPATGLSALTLLAGAVLVSRGRRKR